MILASERDAELLEAMGVPAPARSARAWARTQLDAIEDFYEVYDTDPDGGLAADNFERELRGITGDATVDALADAADLLRRPIDGDLSDWQTILFILDYPHESGLVPIPDALRARVAAVVEAAGGWRAAESRIEARDPEDIEDPWEWAFWLDHQVQAEDIASNVIDLRLTERLLDRLAADLKPSERSEFEAWATRELQAHDQSPRPSHWPPAPTLTLPPATG